MANKVVNHDHDDQRPSRTWWMIPDASAGACAFEPEFHCTMRATYPVGTPRWCETCWIFRKPKIQIFLEIEQRARLKRLAEDEAATVPMAENPVEVKTLRQATTDVPPRRTQRYVVMVALRGGERDYAPGEVVDPFEAIGRWRNLRALERQGYLKPIDPYPVSRAPASSAALPDVDDSFRAARGILSEVPPNRETSTQANACLPFASIPNNVTGWLRSALEMWRKGHDQGEIGRCFHHSDVRVRFCDLRARFGTDVVPYKADPRRIRSD